MPNYLDLMNQLQDQRRAGSSQYNPVNPYSSYSYINRSSDDIYNQATSEAYNTEQAEGYIPSELYKPPTLTEKGISTVSNLSTASQISGKVNPLLGKIGSKHGDKMISSNIGEKLGLESVAQPAATMTNPVYTEWVKQGSVGTAPTQFVANTAQATGQFGLTSGNAALISAAAYSFANDKNPYTYKSKEALGMGVGDYMATSSAMTALGVAAPWMPFAVAGLGYLFRSKKSKKLQKQEQKVESNIGETYTKELIKERNKRDWGQAQKYRERGNTMYAMGAQGMKYKYNTGGRPLSNVMAEFTGNELIVNNQDLVEHGLREKNYSKAAAPIREAMRGGRITPGPETHKNNPMPVTPDGTIYAGGGALPFKVGNGAGVYDHASDQFKSTMSDKQIAMTAQKNINKWKSNNMYS